MRQSMLHLYKGISFWKRAERTGYRRLSICMSGMDAAFPKEEAGSVEGAVKGNIEVWPDSPAF